MRIPHLHRFVTGTAGQALAIRAVGQAADACAPERGEAKRGFVLRLGLEGNELDLRDALDETVDDLLGIAAES